MCKRCPNHARIAKPRPGLTPEEDAARFVLAWERRMIRNGRAWRRPNPDGPTVEGRSTFTWLRPPSWAEGVSVPQSTLVLRPEGCTCDTYAAGYHNNYPACDLIRARASSIERGYYERKAS